MLLLPSRCGAQKKYIYPLFVNTWQYARSCTTANASFAVASIVSRDSATQFTCASGDGAKIPAGGSCVIKDDATGRYASYGVKSVSTDTVVVFDTLPATISSCQQMFDSANGQHLSDYGFYGLGDFLCNSLERYNYKSSNPIFTYYPPYCTAGGTSGADIYNLTTTTKLISVTLLGSASNGGFVSGTDIYKLCQQQGWGNVGTHPLTTYLPSNYLVQDTVAGNGMQFTIPVNGVTGFMEVSLAAVAQLYNSTYYTAGRANLTILADGVSIFNQTYTVGELQVIPINFSGANNLTLQFTCADSVPSSIVLCGVFVNAKPTPADIPVSSMFPNGSSIAFFGDSWTVFPQPVGEQTALLRADGSSSGGMQAFQQRVASRLAADGLSVTTLNWGFGGQTSAWGEYWMKTISSLSPFPTHCVINFGINDDNSTAYGNADSPYDFSPSNIWLDEVKSSGGVNGVTTTQGWYNNLQAMASYLISVGIQPIIMMTPWTASPSQSQLLQQHQLTRLCTGFYPAYTNGGLT